jgi:hypothetical protein
MREFSKQNVPLQVRMPKELLADLRKVAGELNFPLNQICVDALAHMIGQHERLTLLRLQTTLEAAKQVGVADSEKPNKPNNHRGK